VLVDEVDVRGGGRGGHAQADRPAEVAPPARGPPQHERFADLPRAQPGGAREPRRRCRVQVRPGARLGALAADLRVVDTLQQSARSLLLD
jgi:hypothetical protein